MDSLQALIMVLLGLGASAYGTMIGAGGGFVMSPVLLLLYGKSPTVAAATSLSAVVFNAVVAVYSFHQQGRIDYFTALRFSAATIPGAILGSQLLPFIPTEPFKVIFGLILMALAGYMAVRGERPSGRLTDTITESQLRAEGKTVRHLKDKSGRTVVYGYRLRDGLLLSGGVGLMSSLLGVGGGIIMTPAMISLFGLPAHFAAATSQLILLISATTGAVSYLAGGHVDLSTALWLGLGGIVGARLGAWIAQRAKGKLIVRLLAVALLLVGVRLVAGGLRLL